MSNKNLNLPTILITYYQTLFETDFILPSTNPSQKSFALILSYLPSKPFQALQSPYVHSA
jgi:hypothetical protein